jgi:hypothetical protein
MLNGVSEILNLNYKPTQKWHMSCEVLGKGLLPCHPWFLWTCFHPRDSKRF